ncbi:hepcidin-like [Festucalex cinctus]
MKSFSVVIAVTIMLAFICLQENSASPASETQELDDVLDEDSPFPALEETSEESWKMPYSNRHKRAFKCRFCCGCCKPGICGVCCRF